MIEYSQSQGTESAEAENITFKVIGVGGSGANVLDRLALEGSDDAQLLVLNTDIRKLSSSVSSQKVQLGATLLKGMGTGGDPDLGKQSAIEASEEIREAIRGYDMVFVCVGLGGGTGSGAAPEVCRIAREEGVFLVAFTTMPFEFEGARRMNQAIEALRTIEGYANAVVTFDNDRMGELIVPKDGVTQAFAAADKIISQSIRATMNIVSKPGIIRIGMDDLLTALDNENSRCLFGFGQAKGDNRALEAVEQTLKCPLLDGGKLLNNAKNVLVQVSGSDNMTLLEVQTVMKELTGHLRANAHVLFGTGSDPRLGSSLAVTVISSLDANEAEGIGSGDSEISQTHQMDQSPLAAAVTAAAAAAIGEATEIASDGRHALPEIPESMPQMPMAQMPMPQMPMAEAHDQGRDSKIVPITPLEADPAPAAARQEQPMPQFSSDEDYPMESNPIATAVNQAARQEELVASQLEDQPVELPYVAPQPTPLVQPAAAAPQEVAPAAYQEPVPAATAHPQPAAQQPVGQQPTGESIEAQTEQEQTIALSRIVPGQTTQRILNRPARDTESVPVAADPKVTQMPTTAEQLEQQQDILHLEPVQTKGRFAKGDPTIVDGEDLDVPTFLRKKG